ncbi:hypothetical protein LA345_38815 (plasmid) [Burkholderia vietnamiensis]|uniref:Uncharacterized protein n=1 Tax=Burkholderia vietnamiensis (strain G4 / LMG 22486) TaxID=269482 RepID=A4JWC4_BURVG|nr:hypothetical protein Bcep1808_7707 [Burkholderia vietnamiensis G4]MCB4349751.1 hypothetical protein [Burkholderia vietnamiensis]
MNHRRIVCWLAIDPCALVAAKLAIRENDAQANPLPLVVVAHRLFGDEFIEQAARYLGVPVISASSAKWLSFDMPGDVHVWGVPVEEQRAHADIQSAFPSRSFASVLADRALRREDCIELARRAGFTFAPSPYANAPRAAA